MDVKPDAPAAAPSPCSLSPLGVVSLAGNNILIKPIGPSGADKPRPYELKEIQRRQIELV
jgi:hypothetical protein